MNELEKFVNTIKDLINIEESKITDEQLSLVLEQLNEQFSSSIITQAINQIVTNLENQNLTKIEAKEAIEAITEVITDMIYEGEEFTGNKKILADAVVEKITNIFNIAVEKYHSYSIELPIKLEEDAQVPTYAHDTDACADLYALEDKVVNAHTYGNKIRTGVSIQLPEGWVAMIFPRSSIGAKTPFRLSNSVGIIDSGYRGELGVLFDNTSDNDTTINKGDRIAQLLVMPSYRFMPKVVDSLEDSDRGEGGFGSTGT